MACRICVGREGGELVSACACKGSQRWVHVAEGACARSYWKTKAVTIQLGR